MPLIDFYSFSAVFAIPATSLATIPATSFPFMINKISFELSALQTDTLV
ncbi:hypothetical protein DCCM_2397 [Desulfocucumis palustris]|uniref:Uncharacterized protein n=1 Tax=Desulfocucumis palustris TaxID=1898651 RepID=A0A2L2XAU1_9FIRM|nr:hypothetical protein DCCM_2397 [Desulfocucumis palustris]